MTDLIYYVLCAVLIGGVLAGISLMSRVKTAASGNLLSALCVAGAVVLTLLKYDIIGRVELWILIAVGLVAGLLWARRIRMIDMPQVVALLNGFGGASSALVAAIAMLNRSDLSGFSRTTGALALAVGAVTLTGSLIAAGKLHKILAQRPVVWKAHRLITMLALLAAGITVMLIALGLVPTGVAIVLCALCSGFFGVAFAVRVGGADMPITISLLNSLSGVAGAIAGIAISDPLLVAVGGIVGASGLLLTQIMCRAMNRHLGDILTGKTAAPAAVADPAPAETSAAPAPEPEAPQTAERPDPAAVLNAARRVIIVPGYGMAIAQAQQAVRTLADRLEQHGAQVDFAIHPVAGRMPGHMNVLLAEVDVPYEKLREMDDINPEFAQCDVAVVVGANDVVNPAANTAESTPIYGMPVLRVEDAPCILLCNFDTAPGYAGVPNPLYESPRAVLLLGDASETVQSLIDSLA